MYSIYKWAKTYNITCKHKTKFVGKKSFFAFWMGQTVEELS